MNIILIGYRGSGKSSIGKALASLLGRDFADSDLLITQTAGKTIREIFAAEGEAGFRQREAAAIASLAARDNLVIALGGGAVLNPHNLAAFKKNPASRIIWLQAAPEILHQRIQSDAASNATRPNLTAAGGLEEVEKLLQTRTPLYQAAADSVLDVGTLSVEAAARQLAAMTASPQ